MSNLEMVDHDKNYKKVKKMLDKFEPYSDDISLTISEGNNLPELWS